MLASQNTTVGCSVLLHLTVLCSHPPAWVEGEWSSQPVITYMCLAILSSHQSLRVMQGIPKNRENDSLHGFWPLELRNQRRWVHESAFIDCLPILLPTSPTHGWRTCHCMPLWPFWSMLVEGYSWGLYGCLWPEMPWFEALQIVTEFGLLQVYVSPWSGMSHMLPPGCLPSPQESQFWGKVILLWKTWEIEILFLWKFYMFLFWPAVFVLLPAWIHRS